MRFVNTHLEQEAKKARAGSTAQSQEQSEQSEQSEAADQAENADESPDIAAGSSNEAQGAAPADNAVAEGQADHLIVIDCEYPFRLPLGSKEATCLAISAAQS